MALRVCIECPELIGAGARDGRCPAHQRTRDKRRGSRQERGYDAAHVRLRARWARKVATGQVDCWRCDKRISPLDVWHLGHCDDDRSQYHGPEHEACSTATAAHGTCTHISHHTHNQR